jgi:uncharacterized protein YkwD
VEARGRVSVVIAAIAVLGAVALPPLRRNAILEAASQRHSADMARRHFFAHDTPDGMSAGERMSAEGYDYWVDGRRAAIYTTDFGGGP